LETLGIFGDKEEEGGGGCHGIGVELKDKDIGVGYYYDVGEYGVG